VPVPDDIAPEDSFVLDIEQNEEGITIIVEAALRREHPGFYWPPKEGEQNAYGRFAIHLCGEVDWIDGPLLKRSSDVTGEGDYGDLASWWTDGAGTEHLDGEWGQLVVRSPRQRVEELPPTP
jgi:hypothetical protein